MSVNDLKHDAACSKADKQTERNKILDRYSHCLKHQFVNDADVPAW
jgi:hypothetical protein